MQTDKLIEELARLRDAATPGDLTTAERHVGSEWVECPICYGEGGLQAADYCNFDGKALGVQFYGIGPEFGVHEKLWSALRNNLDTILAALKAAQWRPISEAPHETQVLLYHRDNFGREIFEAAKFSTGERLPNGYSNYSQNAYATHFKLLGPAPEGDE